MGARLPADFLERYDDIETQTATYMRRRSRICAPTSAKFCWRCSLITLLLVFTTTWVALFLSKQVTVPIQALAEATREISRGNFDHRIDVQRAG